MADYDDLEDYESDQAPSPATSKRLEEEAEARRARRDAKELESQRAKQRADNEYRKDELLTNFKRWAEYRGEGAMPDDEILESYQVYLGSPMVPSADFTNVPPTAVPDNSSTSLLPVSTRDADQIKFMQSHPPGLHGNQTKWIGTKFLGYGASAQIGLWEYREADGNLMDTAINQVVVKEATMVQPPAPNLAYIGDLTSEAAMMERLAHAESNHIVKPLAKCDMVQPGEHPADRWLTHTKRLYMEYCGMHDLYSLIQWRRNSGNHFKETTIWRILDCLADALMVLEFGNEASIQHRSGDVMEPSARYVGPTSWRSIIHFDIKPENIFLADDRAGTHKHAPIFKLGDFGLSQFAPNKRNSDWELQWRIAGSEGFYPPEQFTERWNFSDWKETGVAGLYGPHSNIWGLGCILYALVTCQIDNHVDIKYPFKPSWEINGEESKGTTYGIDLQSYTLPDTVPQYSEKLIHTIWECLYEKPEHRPTAFELKERVVAAFRPGGVPNVDDLPANNEPWSSFVVPEGPGMNSASTNLAGGGSGSESGGSRDGDSGGDGGDVTSVSGSEAAEGSEPPVVEGGEEAEGEEEEEEKEEDEEESDTKSNYSDDFYRRYPDMRDPPSDDDDSGSYAKTGHPSIRSSARVRARGFVSTKRFVENEGRNAPRKRQRATYQQAVR